MAEEHKQNYRRVKLQRGNNSSGITDAILILFFGRRDYNGGITSTLITDADKYNRGISAVELQRRNDSGRNYNCEITSAEEHKQ